jgi:hypothetical protein
MKYVRIFSFYLSPIHFYTVQFVCPQCTSSTRRRTVCMYSTLFLTYISPLPVDWEGPDALEPSSSPDPSESDTTQDEYIAHSHSPKSNRHGKVRLSYFPFVALTLPAASHPSSLPLLRLRLRLPSIPKQPLSANFNPSSAYQPHSKTQTNTI